MKSRAVLSLLLVALMLSLTNTRASSATPAGEPSTATLISKSISVQDCGGVRDGGGGCFLGCCRSIAIGDDCNGNVCVVTFEVCSSGAAFLTFEGDC